MLHIKLGNWPKRYLIFLCFFFYLEETVSSKYRNIYIHANLKLEHMSKSIILTERTISKLLKEEGKGRRQV